MLQYRKRMYRTCSTPKNKITRNVPGSERELRIERFMTARFADRPLGEVGGVSRNRLLVDKMIVWRTILGLIMASKWPAPESQSACRFSTARARDQRKQIPAMRAPMPRAPRQDFINWSMAAACDSAVGLSRVTAAKMRVARIIAHVSNPHRNGESRTSQRH
jgi:hypothetical protein